MFLAFKNGVKSIQTAGYNGGRTVYKNSHMTIWQNWRFGQELKFLLIAQLLALIIFVPVSLMRENMRRLLENLKHKIRSSVLDPRRRRMDEDPLLSDHPYGAQTARRPPPTTPNSTAQSQQDPLLSDHPYGSPTGGRPPPTGEYRYRSSIISQWLERQESK